MNKKITPVLICLIVVLGVGAPMYNYLSKLAPPDEPLIIYDAPDSEASNSISDNEGQINPHEDAPDSAPPSDDRIPAPDFTVYDASGGEIKLSDMLGAPVVLNFWASWCPPCRSEMPDFEKVYLETGDTVRFMMINATDGSRETVKSGAEYIAEHGYSFPVYYDTDQDAAAKYGIRALPTSVFIDADGYVAAGAEGAIDEAALRTGIGMIMADGD